MSRSNTAKKVVLARALVILLLLALPACSGNKESKVMGEGEVTVEEQCPSEETAADKLVKSGRYLVEHKRMAEARACFKKAVVANPKYIPGLLEAGQSAIVEGRNQEAVNLYAAALKMEVSTPALNNMAIAYHQMGSHVDAVAVYRRVIKIDEDDAVAYYNLGTALEKAGDYKDASKAYRQAIELEPEEAKYYNNMGGCLAALDKEETAERSYKWAIKIDKRFADAYYNYGNFLLGKGRLEESIERLEGCLKIAPEHDKCTSKMASAKEALDKKVADFKDQIDEAISKAEKMRSRGEL